MNCLECGILVACFICCICKSSFILIGIMKNVQCMMNMHDLTYLNNLRKPVNIKASALLIIHIWSNLLNIVALTMHVLHTASPL